MNVSETISRIDIHSYSALLEQYKATLRGSSYGGPMAREIKINDRAVLHISPVPIHIQFKSEDDYYKDHVSPSSPAYEEYMERKRREGK